MNRLRSRSLFWTLLSLAIVLRGIFALQTLAEGPFVEPNSDARFYDQWARAVARGNLLLKDDWLSPREGAPRTGGGEVFHLPPLYPYLLAVVYAPLGWLGLSDQRVACVTGLQLGLGIANLVLVFALARRLFGEAAALWAMALGVFSSVLMYWEGKLLITTLAVFLSLLVLQQILVLRERPSRRRALAVGLLLGASILARPNFLPFAGLAWLWLVWRGRGEREGWRQAGLLAAGLILPLALSLGRNWIVASETVLVSDNGGVNFYFGNHPGASGLNMAPDLRFANIFDQAGIARRIAEESEGRRGLSASEVSAHFYALGRKLIAESPGAWLEVEWRKLRLLLGDFEAGIGWVPEAEATLVPIVGLLPVRFAVLFAFSVLGLVVAWRRQRLGASFPLALFLIVNASVVMLFFFAARLRTPMSAVLLVYAGLGAQTLISSVLHRQSLGTALPIVLGTGALSWLIVDGDFRDRLLSNVHHTQGERLLAQGRIESARQQLERSVTLDPGSGQAIDGLARLLLAEVAALRCTAPSDLDSRIALLRRAEQLVAPQVDRFPYARMTLGEVYLQPEIGEYDAAARSFLSAAEAFQQLAASPAFAKIRAARALWFDGRTDSALGLVEEVRRVDAELRADPDVLLIEGLMRAELEAPGARDLLEDALASASEALDAGATPSATIILEQVIIEASLETGDVARARQVFRRLSERSPCAALSPRSASLEARLLEGEGRAGEAKAARERLERRYPRLPR
ncbi:MAG: glycosyltransferase family 39 protein [Planctomycetota bacterium]